jgi:predicted RNase H-like nuclease (RuvC/YqgF family)
VSHDLNYFESKARSHGRFKRKLVVGIDPGTTCGLAVLDLDARPVLIESSKGTTRDAVIHRISEAGDVIIVASDVSPAPDFVRRVASSLKAIVFTPEAAIESTEKHLIVQDYIAQHGIKSLNPHSQDAMAAALKALRHYGVKFKQVESCVKALGGQVPLDEAKALVARGYTIKRALDLLIKRKEERGAIKAIQTRELRELTSLRKRGLEQRRQIERLEVQNQKLLEKVKQLKSEVEGIESQREKERIDALREMKKERIYQIQRSEIENLRAQLEKAKQAMAEYQQRFDRLKHLREREARGEIMLLKPIESFTSKGIEDAVKTFDIGRGDSVILLNASGGGPSTAKTLAEIGLSVVIACTPMSHEAEKEFEDSGTPLLSLSNLRVEWIEGYPYVYSKELRTAVESIGKLEDTEEKQLVRGIIDEYRGRKTEDL